MAVPTPPFQPAYLNLEYLFYKIYQLFLLIYNALFQGNFWVVLYAWLRIIFSLAAIFFIAMIAYTSIRIRELKKQEKEQLKKFIVREPVVSVANDKWEKIKGDILSVNPSDWRLAIIEADTMLDEMLKGIGYQGADLGERLKSADPADFLSLDDAWEAHKVRNRIAHDGSAFALDQKEAHRIIGLYERVFREFKYI
jgi:hypothetical protein